MQGLPEADFSFKNPFTPLTTVKAITIIIIVGFIVFGNMLFNGFVWDDLNYIILNPDIHTGNFFQLIGSNIFNTGLQYRPISALYFAVFYHIAGIYPFFYHFIQLIIHIVNASLLFAFFNHFLRKKFSLFLSLVFLIHPIQVESVSYIASSDNPLFFLFGLSALLLSMKEIISVRRCIAISCLILFSLLIRETAILFLFVVLAYRFIFRNRNVKISLFYSFVTLLVYLSIRFGLGGFNFAIPTAPIEKLSLTERLVNIPAIIFYYLKTFFFPAQLLIQQIWTIRTIDFAHFYFPLIIDILFFLLLGLFEIYLFREHKRDFKIYNFFLLWFIGGLFLHSQVVPLDWTVADRWFYFPVVGLLGIIGVSIKVFKPANTKIQVFIYAIGILLLVILSARTVVRNADWTDALTLYTHDSKLSDNYVIETYIGDQYLYITQQYNEAIKHYKISATLYPDETNLYDLGAIYQKLGNYQKAKEYYYKLIRSNIFINKNIRTWTYENLSLVLLHTDSPLSTAEFIKSALYKLPHSGKLWEDLAICEYRLGKREAALTAAENAKSLLQTEEADGIYNAILNKQPVMLNQ